MWTSRTKRNLGRGASVAVLAATLIAPSEGLWTTAKTDWVGTGHPATVCYGMTSADRPVRVGDKYTPEQCMAFLEADIPKYQKPLERCVHVKLTNHQWAAIIDGAYNAGSGAMCKSPMVRAFNAGDPRACDKFIGWYERAGGKHVKGLANRRERERKFCKTPDEDAT